MGPLRLRTEGDTPLLSHCTRSAGVLLLLLACAAPLYAGDRPFQLALAASVAADTADLATTVYALQQPGTHEANVMMRHPAMLVGGKAAMLTVFPFVQSRLRKTHPKLAIAMLVLNAGIKGWATAHNVRLTRSAAR